MPRISTSILTLLNGNPRTTSSANKSRRQPATPMEVQHSHFSMEIPFTACMRRSRFRSGTDGGTDRERPRRAHLLIVTIVASELQDGRRRNRRKSSRESYRTYRTYKSY